MAIEKEVKKKWGWDKRHEIITYRDTDKGRVYGRIVCGLGWPYAEKPAFVVTLAQDFKKDHSIPFSPYHLYLLEEFESSNLEELYRHCLKCKEEFYATNIMGNPENSVHDIFRRCGSGNSYVTVTEPSNLEDIDLNYVAQLIRRHGQHNTLHIGGERSLPGFFQLLRAEDIVSKPIEQFPPIAALGYALSYLEKYGGESLVGWTPTRKITPRW